MKLKEITGKEFEKYAISHPLYTFHQTKEWAELKAKNGWDHVYVGLIENKKIVGATLLLSKITPIKKKMYYAPRGFLIDFNNQKLTKEFTKKIGLYVKKNNGIFVKIDPPIVYKQRDVDGNIIESGLNNESLISFLKKSGYKHYGLNKSSHKELQPRWVFVLPIGGKTKDEIYSNFNTRTKRSIKKCNNSGVIVEEMSSDDLQVFKDIMEHTSTRRGFLDRPFSYYKNMIEILGDKCKIFIAYLDVDKAIELQKEVILQEEAKILQYEKTKESKKSQQGIEKSNEVIAVSKKEIEKLVALEKNNGKKIPLSSSMFLLTEKEMTYLFGGSYQEYMNYPSQYLIQWSAICDSIEHGHELFNFYGIDGNLNEDGEMHGVYEFKRGFDGEVREYIGEFDLIVSKFYYFIYNVAFKMYKGSKHLLIKIKGRK